jgi:hypothetical protein
MPGNFRPRLKGVNEKGHAVNQTRETLLRKRSELVSRLAAIRKDLSSGLDADSKEQAIQLENIDVLREIARISEEEIARIDRQLKADDHSD